MSRDNIVVGGVGDACRGRVVGVSTVPREGGWFKEAYTVIGPGSVVVAREPCSLLAEPPRSDEPLVENSEATTDTSVDGTRWSTGIEDWEKPLLAAAIYSSSTVYPLLPTSPRLTLLNNRAPAMVSLSLGTRCARFLRLIFSSMYSSGGIRT